MSAPTPYVRTLVRVTGIVQGVGFRPTVFRHASAARVSGYTFNDPDGVEIEAVGLPHQVDHFLRLLRDEPPPLAHIEAMRILERVPVASLPPGGFRIEKSRSGTGRTTLVPADIATCPDCVREMLDPSDPRYRYPFLNCTNCGPRYTIISDIPYDRPVTSMAAFPMCDRCRQEYENPLDRRFHAQPTCCPVCGPALALLDACGRPLSDSPDPVPLAIRMLQEGRILAVKGLGGFHLACNAADAAALAALRTRKHRDEKPFAVMVASADTAAGLAHVSPAERALLESRERPIVLLLKKEPFPLAEAVAPGNRQVGVMLPYTPLHHLLLDSPLTALVMTSGNLSDEPIVRDNAEAVERLRGIADAFLVHNRDILVRADDSVVRCAPPGNRAEDSVVRCPAGNRDGKPRTLFLRRSRGFVPVPIDMAADAGAVLAVGAELKNTVCITRGRHAFVSQHIGDLEDERTLAFFRETVAHLSRITEVSPDVVAHDMHPDYLSTRFASSLAMARTVPVQHHHAHILACLAEHHFRDPVLGVALDGTGYGPDGTIWGSEFLLVDGPQFERLGHFRYLPLPGNANAIREPWRMALALLHDALDRTDRDRLADALARSLPGPLAATHSHPDSRSAGAPEQATARAQAVAQTLALLDRNHPFVRSCGAGRLFDAVSALLGIRLRSSFEGQAAMELEMTAALAGDEPAYPVDLLAPGPGSQAVEVDFRPAIRSLVRDHERGASPQVLARRFHSTVATVVVDTAAKLARARNLRVVALSGGVFQNRLLAARVEAALEAAGLSVLTHCLVPPNDGGISLGQAYLCTFPFPVR